jgi:tetratricopeptide (TPR) repeat protein
VAVATYLAFLPALENAFVNFDDDRLVLRNPYLRQPWSGALSWMVSTMYMGHYQPLTWLSLAADYSIAGVRPFVYHLDSLLWHVSAALLVYVLLIELWKRTAQANSHEPSTITREPQAITRESAAVARNSRVQACAAAGALFWSVHPLRVESVAWTAERRDPISVVFLLLAAIAYLFSVEVGRAQLKSARWYWVSFVCLLCSVLAKAWGLTFFVSLLALDVYPLRRLPLAARAFTDARYRPVWLQKVPMAAIGVSAGALAWAAQHSQPDTMPTLSEWPLASRLLQAGYGVCFYVWKTLWPARLSVMYERSVNEPAAWSLWVMSTIAIAVALLVLLRAQKNPGLFVVGLVYLATLSPVLGLAQSGPQLVADRYAYASSVPFSALVMTGLMKVRRRALAASLAVMCTAALAAATWRQTGFWHDSLTLWSHALSVGPPSYTAHLDYGQALRADGRLDDALAQYEMATVMRPDSGNAWYNLANALKAKGRLDEAEAAYRTALLHLSWKVDAQVNLGNLYFNRRQLPAAIGQYRAATATLSTRPPVEVSPEPFLYLGMALADNGERVAALDALNAARRYPATRARAERELERIRAADASGR